MMFMAKDVDNITQINPAWPAHTPGNGHPVTEISSKLTFSITHFRKSKEKQEQP